MRTIFLIVVLAIGFTDSTLRASDIGYQRTNCDFETIAADANPNEVTAIELMDRTWLIRGVEQGYPYDLCDWNACGGVRCRDLFMHEESTGSHEIGDTLWPLTRQLLHCPENEERQPSKKQVYSFTLASTK